MKTLASLVTEARLLLNEVNYEALAKHSNVAVRSYAQNMLIAPDDRDDMVKLWDEILKAPGDVNAARAAAKKIGIDPGLATFHARKLGTAEKYPSGAEMLKAVEAEDARLKKAKEESPPKSYQGSTGSRYRPYGRST